MPVRFFPIDKVEFSLSTWDHYSVSLSVQHLLPRSVLLWSDIEQRQPPCQVAGLSYHAKSHETFSDVGLVIPSHRLILSMLYGCGLRSYELCNLLQSDIDFERKTVFVKKQKGKIDRYVPLSSHLIRGLKKYFETENPIKHVFNSQITKDGEVGALTTRGIQWVIKECRSKVKTKKKFTAHTLRHSYATHLLEDGLNIMSLKELLGHAHIETTIVYLQVSNFGSSEKFSPLDTLFAK